MSAVGKSIFSQRLAANLWAREALEVTISAMGGIKIANSDEVGIGVPAVVSSRFIAAVWHGFCREVGCDSRAVWFSDAIPIEEDFAVIDVRNRITVDRRTGTAARTGQEVLVAGVLMFTVRYAPDMKFWVECFLKMLDQGWIRLGSGRSVHGAVDVLETKPCYLEYAREQEEKIPVPSITPESPYAEKARELVQKYSLDKYLDKLRDELRVATGAKGPLSTHLYLLVQSTKKSFFALRQEGCDERLGKALGDAIVYLPNMAAVREFFDQMLVAASAK